MAKRIAAKLDKLIVPALENRCALLQTILCLVGCKIYIEYIGILNTYARSLIVNGLGFSKIFNLSGESGVVGWS